jgi:hypothetical protein
MLIYLTIHRVVNYSMTIQRFRSQNDVTSMILNYKISLKSYHVDYEIGGSSLNEIIII